MRLALISNGCGKLFLAFNFFNQVSPDGKCCFNQNFKHLLVYLTMFQCNFNILKSKEIHGLRLGLTRNFPLNYSIHSTINELILVSSSDPRATSNIILLSIFYGTITFKNGRLGNMVVVSK